MLHSIACLMWSILIVGMIMLIVYHIKRTLQIKRNKIVQWEEIGYNGFGSVMFGVI
jgi:hypothetical protein